MPPPRATLATGWRGARNPEVGVWLALVGGLLSAAGSGLFAEEIEGDDDLDDTAYGRGPRA